MLHEKKRRATFLSESAESEANPVDFNELRGGRDVPICHVSFVRSVLAHANSVDPPEVALGEALRPPTIRLY
jgi:hypothetical protein